MCLAVVKPSDANAYILSLFSPVAVEADGVKCEGDLALGYMESFKLSAIMVKVCPEVITVLNLIDESRLITAVDEEKLCHTDGEHRVCIRFGSPVQAALFRTVTMFIPFTFTYYDYEEEEGVHATFHKLYTIHRELGGLTLEEAADFIRLRILKSLIDDCVYEASEPDLREILEKFGDAMASIYVETVDELVRALNNAKRVR